MRDRTLLLVVAATALVVPVLGGCIGTNPSSGGSGPAGTADNATELAPQPSAVIGLQDNGINPYHTSFRDDSPRAYVHPSEYIPDYPEDAVGLNLTFDAEDIDAALKADCRDVWSEIEPGQLYWFPGTKIVGAITFQDVGDVDCDSDKPRPGGIYAFSHGTATSSRAVGNDHGACPDCHLVMVEGFNDAGVEWLGNSSDWIDVQSHSWGPITPAYTGPVDTALGPDQEFVRTVESSARQNLAFWASGNGIATRLGVVGHPTLLTPHFTPSVVIVGGHDNGYMNTWPGFPPHVVADSCNSWAAKHYSMDERSKSFGGTSSATPFAAGSAAKIVLQARRMTGQVDTGVHDGVVASGNVSGVDQGPLDDGELTLDETRELVRKTATPRPGGQEADGDHCEFGEEVGIGTLYDSTPVPWSQVPEAYPQYLQIGYGARDDVAFNRSMAVLEGDEAMPDRTEEDAFFEMDQQARQEMYQVWAGEVAPSVDVT